MLVFRGPRLILVLLNFVRSGFGPNTAMTRAGGAGAGAGLAVRCTCGLCGILSKAFRRCDSPRNKRSSDKKERKSNNALLDGLSAVMLFEASKKLSPL